MSQHDTGGVRITDIDRNLLAVTVFPGRLHAVKAAGASGVVGSLRTAMFSSPSQRMFFTGSFQPAPLMLKFER